MVGVWLPALALFVSLAIDFAHFFDYSRNLQNRADAAALAAGARYGGTCFGTPSQAGLDNIGETAQQYSGPLAGADVPFTAAQMTGRTNYNLPNLTAGVGGNLHILLNSTANWGNLGAGDWTMGTAATVGSDKSFCDGGTENGVALGPVADVRVTQDQLPLFFPLLGFKPTIHAHARVSLEGAAGTDTLPIAVPDPAQTPCMRAEVINDNTGARVNDANGNPIDVAMTPPNPAATPPTTFWTATLPRLNVPAAQLSVQAYVPDDCANPGYPSAGALYDSATTPGHGIAFINTYTPLPAGDPANPALGSVFLTPVKDCTDATEAANQDAYFYYFPKSTSCSVTVNAQVKFPSAMKKTEVDVSMDGANAQKMNAGANNAYSLNFSIPSKSGRHTFVLSWKAQGANGSFNGGNPVQATYSAFSDGSDPADDSGPITQAFVGDTAGDVDVDTLQQGSTQTALTVAFRLQGLELAQPGDQPIVLRAAVQNRKATGAFDCGQGTGAQALHDAIVNGCPDPVSIYSAPQGCVTLPTTPLTCASLVPGNRRNQVTQAFQDRIATAVDNGKASPCDAWQAYAASGTAISGFEPWNTAVVDPRIMVMVVTAPADLAGHGGPNNLVRILGFATFYVTGYDGDPWLPNGKGKGGGAKIPNCSAPTDQDDPYPGTDNSNGKDQIWGHFIKYVAVGGTPNGNPCNPADPSVCVPALTR